jgi:hypothetical protein
MSASYPEDSVPIARTIVDEMIGLCIMGFTNVSKKGKSRAYRIHKTCVLVFVEVHKEIAGILEFEWHCVYPIVMRLRFQFFQQFIDRHERAFRKLHFYVHSIDGVANQQFTPVQGIDTVYKSEWDRGLP